MFSLSLFFWSLCASVHDILATAGLLVLIYIALAFTFFFGCTGFISRSTLQLSFPFALAAVWDYFVEVEIQHWSQEIRERAVHIHIRFEIKRRCDAVGGPCPFDSGPSLGGIF